MGAFGAWHYFHELYMSPPPGQPTPDGNPEEHRKVFTNGISKELRREEARLAVKKSLYSSGIWLAILTILAAVASYFGIEVRK